MSVSDWSVVGSTVADASAVAAQALSRPDVATGPAQAASSRPTNVDMELLQRLLPGKAAEKLASWVKVLHDEEIETVEDAGALLSDANKSDWDGLALPAAVRAKLREDFQQILMAKRLAATATSPVEASPTHVDPAAGVGDAGPNAGDDDEDDKIQQLDCIVIDVSGSMKSRSVMDPLKTREDVSKFTFHLMVDKILALEMHHAVSLVAFGREITDVKALTTEYEAFHDEMGRLDARQAATRLYDAVDRAAAQLVAYRDANAGRLVDKCPLRVFALTDGEDNSSRAAAWSVARRLQEAGVVLDALPLGTPNATLQAMATATGGLCVDVVDEQQATTLFNREALMHVASRDEAERTAKPLLESAEDLSQYGRDVRVVRDVASAHGKQLLASATLKATDVAAAVEAKASKSAPKGAGALRRVLKEYKEMQQAGREDVEVHVSEDDVAQWKVMMRGPAGSVYEGAWFGLTAKFPGDYPFSPPAVRYATPVYHCNVSNDGHVCMDILMSKWNPAVSMAKVVDALLDIMANPNADDPLDAWKGQLLKSEPERYQEAAKKWTAEKAYASLDAARAGMNVTSS